MTPHLEQFRIEAHDGGIVHFVFDMPGRSMNVFSNAAIHELGAFADWLAAARDVTGVVIRSGKTSGFCAGADLNELGVAYDMIVAARPESRFDIAFDHFFSLSHAIRRLERAGKPIAVAIAGIALGGGCELAMGGHHRVLVDSPGATLGLPESLVGLLPGGGGTQRLPRLVGVSAALPVLLDGARLSGSDAVAAGLADVLVQPGDEVEAAEAWLRSSSAHAVQPWDRASHVPVTPGQAIDAVERRRSDVLLKTLGHYPAPLAILDCLEQGLPQGFDAAIRTEMSIFADLIQRREARDMIQVQFLGRQDHDRAVRSGGLDSDIEAAIEVAREIFAPATEHAGLSRAGFGEATPDVIPYKQGRGYWLDSGTPEAIVARTELRRLLELFGGKVPDLTPDQHRIADYAIVNAGHFPAYLGGPFHQRSRAGGSGAT